ncbi:MAG: hypothetical protein HYZ27_01550 [Deltaproteobacteria bacterium]|nr:hypothetical protein [Deltaproteobacteria bacterium]
MTLERVGQVQNRALVYEGAQSQELRVRLSLFNASEFQRVSAVQFQDGSGISIPTMSEQDRTTVAHLFGGVPLDQQAAVQEAANRLAAALYVEGATNAEGVKVGSFSSGVTAALGEAATIYGTATKGGAIDQQMQGTMFMALAGLEGDLQDFAVNVRGKLALVKELRTDITELRDAVANWPEGVEKQKFSWREVTIDEAGNVKVVERSEYLTKEQAAQKADSLEEMKNSLQDLTEMDKFDLQRMTQDYQQAVNTLSALLKSNHDSLKSIIGNLKA